MVLCLPTIAGSQQHVTLAGIFPQGWAKTHLAAATIAVHRINADPNILPGVKLVLEAFDIEPVVQAKSSHDPLKKCYVNSVLTDERFENVSVVLGVGYSTDVHTLMPFLDKMDILLMTHSAASSEFSDKTKFPNFARFCRSTEPEGASLVDIVHSVIKHKTAKLINCGDSYCRDCARQVQRRGDQIGVRIVDTYDYGDFTFSDVRDVQLSTRLDDIVNNCSVATVVIVCGHKDEARNIMKTAHITQAQWQKESTQWVMSAWPAGGSFPTRLACCQPSSKCRL